MLCGIPGIGKSALLEYAVHSASGFRVVRVAGIEIEQELPYAALHQMYSALRSHTVVLPPPQRKALAVIFGAEAGEAPDRLMVDLAVLGLLSAAAVDQPLLCVLDDAQWLDSASAQVMSFVAHRISAEPLAIAFATRPPNQLLNSLPEITLRGLRPADARALLLSALHAPLDEPVTERILAEARGNPLTLTELPRMAAPNQFAGGFSRPDALALSEQIEPGYRQRVASLPPDTRTLLLVAAAEPEGDVSLLWRAARYLGIAPSAFDAAETDGLVEVREKVTFLHPLARSALYRAAGLAQRQAAHRVLANVTDPETDPEWRAWHLEGS
ncbi:LuxR family transcriptional regulator [Streptomyces malaysiensis]|uniref:LuxR family transcriptional regulator n=1 Tax=Streptomyces malaysiensis TaxID=92644 RepID=A0A7X5XCP5_STRMQ|nr:LuxR family transcriptional regulator [Streptomyces malaysiensis]